MSAEKGAWSSRFWTTTYSPLRAFWFLRSLYLLLAADLWFGMIEHGGRYGVGGFNVSHLPWLDLLLPVPSAALYVGLLIAASFLALLLGLGPAPRWLRLTLAAVYTFGWLLSIHDSYQHHYLLSWLLCWCAALPDPSARRALSSEPTSGWGLPMSAITCAIVYFFTGISKSESDWRSGEALRSLTRSAPPGSAHPGKFDGARDLLLALGLDDASVWQLFALATIALQWTIAVAYLAAPLRDAQPSRARVWLCSLGLFGALSFHGVAELFHVFEIGLFSYYMAIVALLVLGPVSPWRPLTRALAWLGEQITGPLDADAPRSLSLRELARPLGSALLLAAVGFTIPLPGAELATCALALGVMAYSVVTLLHARRAPDATVRGLDLLALQTTFCTFVLWLALTQTSVPFDYYRRTAGELYRMGQVQSALSLYRQGERYAPAGESRAARIRELQRELESSSHKRRD